MSRQAALLLALAALAVAGALISFGTWIILRRGNSSNRSQDDTDLTPPAPSSK
jgi:hypothetical protein